jgi:hypothetical protein
MLADARKLVVIEPRTPHTRLVERKTEWMHEVQRRAHVGAQADYIAGIRRDLWVKQDDVEHRAASVALRTALADNCSDVSR